MIEVKRKALHEKLNGKNDLVLLGIAKKIRKQNQDIVGKKCLKDSNNKLAFSDGAKTTA